MSGQHFHTHLLCHALLGWMYVPRVHDLKGEAPVNQDQVVDTYIIGCKWRNVSYVAFAVFRCLALAFSMVKVEYDDIWIEAYIVTSA
jgi:hypothetical protein